MRDKKSYKAYIYKANSKVTEVSPSLSVITLNVNGLNSSIKTQDWWNG